MSSGLLFWRSWASVSVWWTWAEQALDKMGAVLMGAQAVPGRFPANLPSRKSWWCAV